MNKVFSQKWLQLLSSELNGFESAIIMMQDYKTNQLLSIARWPTDFSDLSVFSVIVKQTIKKKEMVCFPHVIDADNHSSDLYAFPLNKGSSLIGILLIKTTAQPAAMQKVVFSAMKKGIKWLLLSSSRNYDQDEFYPRVVALLAASFEQSSYQQTLVNMVTELTKTFKCERVAFAEYKSLHSRVIALSNSASFDGRSNLIQHISFAMDESIEQDSPVLFPNSGTRLIQRAHQELARKFGVGSVLTIPLCHEDNIFGSISLMRSEKNPFSDKDKKLCEQTFSLITPYLVLKKEKEKNLILKNGDAIKKLFINTFGVRRLKLKLISITVALLILMSSVIEGDFRISAQAIMEGKIQRVVTAPFAGYLLSASRRAGDTVNAGDVMASLDDADLKLELKRLQGGLQKTRREFREAQSTRDLVKVSIVSEQIKQIAAEIDLIHQQLDRVNLTAPFDGVVIEGDLSQALGSPVEKGETLFKIAPLDGYRIILMVDEKQISYVKKGQTGTLILPSLTEKSYPLTVEKITIASKVESGANIFRVEASINNTTDKLRPGMQGVGKILVGRGPLIWNWTHDTVGMIRLWLWTWWP